MKTLIVTALAAFAFSNPLCAQTRTAGKGPEQFKSGEAGYKVGCTIANSVLKQPVCQELKKQPAPQPKK